MLPTTYRPALSCCCPCLATCWRRRSNALAGGAVKSLFWKKKKDVVFPVHIPVYLADRAQIHLPSSIQSALVCLLLNKHTLAPLSWAHLLHSMSSLARLSPYLFLVCFSSYTLLSFYILLCLLSSALCLCLGNIPFLLNILLLSSPRIFAVFLLLDFSLHWVISADFILLPVSQ